MNEREANDRAGSIRDSIERLRDEKENLSESLLDKSDLMEEKEKQIQYAKAVNYPKILFVIFNSYNGSCDKNSKV